MAEFSKVTFYDKTVDAWAYRGAIGIYMILLGVQDLAYYVVFRAYDSSELRQLPSGFLTYRRAVAAAARHEVAA